MTPEDFSFVARMLRRRSGLSLPLSKLSHAEDRLQAVVRLFDLKDMSGLVRQLRLGHEALASAVTEAMTVNETSFFRDSEIFDRFAEEVLPRFLSVRRHTKRLRIWSAAAATGQETYSLAMILAEQGLESRGWTIDILATDISGHAITRAEEGLYTDAEAQRGLTPDMRAAWFHAEGRHWRVCERLRRMVRFRKFNLLDSMGWLDDLDIVFCRNVLMYLDRPGKASLLERIAETMAPDGVLVLGANENITPGVLAPAYGGNGIYGLRPPPGARLAG